MSLKELFSRMGKRKPEEPAPSREVAPPAEAVEYKPAKVPANAPACWEERWGKDMVTVPTQRAPAPCGSTVPSPKRDPSLIC